jgi:hypothetical protein
MPYVGSTGFGGNVEGTMSWGGCGGAPPGRRVRLLNPVVVLLWFLVLIKVSRIWFAASIDMPQKSGTR